MPESNPIFERMADRPVISFKTPAHEMCVERKAVLSRLDGRSEYMTFAIDFMPDKIHINDRKFVYAGVSDGRGFYREMPRDAHEARAIAVCERNGWPIDLRPIPDGPLELREVRSELLEPGVTTGSIPASKKLVYDSSISACAFEVENAVKIKSELLEPARQIAQNFISAALAVREADKAHKSREEPSVCSAENGCGNQQTSAGGPGFFHAEIPGSESRLSPPVEVHTAPENANPAPEIPCSRCSEALDLVSQMIENPPGLSGIKCHLGHVGNHFVDAGWVEALTRVKWHLVTGGSGARGAV
jgi:hypothetical protein